MEMNGPRIQANPPRQRHFGRGECAGVGEPTSSMQSTLSALDRRTTEDTATLRMLCISLGVLLAILPLAHVTALRNLLVGVTAGLALLQFRFGPWRSVP